jgi:hypothetical protein
MISRCAQGRFRVLLRSTGGDTARAPSAAGRLSAPTLPSEQTELTVLLGRLTASVSLIEALGGGWNAAQLK